jgi:hypothetical protein
MLIEDNDSLSAQLQMLQEECDRSTRNVKEMTRPMNVSGMKLT